MSQFISGDELKEKLLADFGMAREVKLITAYLTLPAIDWMKSIVKDNQKINIAIVARISTQDILAGSTDLSALREALSSSCKVYSLPNLHAKIYLIDATRIYVGSSNFTSNGLKLYGSGNLEAMVELVPKEKDLEFVSDIINSSSEINLDTLDLMESYIENIEQHNNSDATPPWPEEIIPVSKDVWVSDFPLSNPLDANENSEFGPIFQNIYSIKSKDEMCAEFSKTKAYTWLYDMLMKNPNREVYFGEMTKLLHDSLKDDPAPYRKNVKQLLANLLGFCEILSKKNIEIDRPNHSQRIKLLM